MTNQTTNNTLVDFSLDGRTLLENILYNFVNDNEPGGYENLLDNLHSYQSFLTAIRAYEDLTADVLQFEGSFKNTLKALTNGVYLRKLTDENISELIRKIVANLEKLN